MAESTIPYEKDWDRLELPDDASWLELMYHVEVVEEAWDKVTVKWQNAQRDHTVLTAFLDDEHYLVVEAKKLLRYYEVQHYWYKELYYKMNDELKYAGGRKARKEV